MNSQQEPIAAEHIGPPPLRFQFVGMLFALAVAEVAVKWAQLAAKFGLSVAAWPAHLHLILATCLIATSWIGWSWSVAAGNVRQIEHPFSVEFLILLVDVALVILYFMIARSAEFIETAYPEPSAREESYLVAAIFGIYFFWDFLTKALFPSPQAGKSRASEFWSRGRVSGSCFVISIVAAWWVGGVKGAVAVCIADVGLLALVFLFRAWKRAFWRTAAVCAIIFAACCVLARFWA